MTVLDESYNAVKSTTGVSGVTAQNELDLSSEISSQPGETVVVGVRIIESSSSFALTTWKTFNVKVK